MYNEKRWQLLPMWLKLIVVIYSTIGSAVIIALILEPLGFSVPLSIYGISTPSLFNFKGLIILLFFSLKGYTGVLFLIGNKNAPIIGIIDSIFGIIACTFTGFIWPFINGRKPVDIVFRLELIILFLLLRLFFKLKKTWHAPFIS